MKQPKTQKQALMEAFKAALDASSVTATEMAWNLKLEPGQIVELLDGTLKPTDEQECTMLWFLFREKAMPPMRLLAIGGGGRKFNISIDEVDPLI